MDSERMRFGIFLAPFHPEHEHPGLALERDFQLVEHLDRLGYDEAWIGEHHSAGFEIIASPEVFIAAAAERTRRIRLGTGVSSLPYHHPLLLADRVMQLDHQTRGRFMFGVGPGALPSDAIMMGIDPLQQRRMMDEALSVLVPLLEGRTVTKQTDWFTLQDARLQLEPYTLPRMEMAVAAQTSPAGPVAAGKYGMGMLSIGATSIQGYLALGTAWGICEQSAREHGRQVRRRDWRLVAPMHVAETREQALANVRFGIHHYIRYFTEVLATAIKLSGSMEDMIHQLLESGYVIIGTPEDAVTQIQRLQEQSGGFGCLLQQAHNWADFPQTLRSYELIARYVMPHLQGWNAARRVSLGWAKDHHDEFMGVAMQAKTNATEQYKAAQEQKARQSEVPGRRKPKARAGD